MIRPEIDWSMVPKEHRNLIDIVNNCKNLKELTETTLVYLDEYERYRDSVLDGEQYEWMKTLKNIFVPIYSLITGIRYETKKFETC